MKKMHRKSSLTRTEPKESNFDKYSASVRTSQTFSKKNTDKNRLLTGTKILPKFMSKKAEVRSRKQRLMSPSTKSISTNNNPADIYQSHQEIPTIDEIDTFGLIGGGGKLSPLMEKTKIRKARPRSAYPTISKPKSNNTFQRLQSITINPYKNKFQNTNKFMNRKELAFI